MYARLGAIISATCFIKNIGIPSKSEEFLFFTLLMSDIHNYWWSVVVGKIVFLTFQCILEIFTALIWSGANCSLWEISKMYLFNKTAASYVLNSILPYSTSTLISKYCFFAGSLLTTVQEAWQKHIRVYNFIIIIM